MMEEVGTFPHNLANSSPVVDQPALLHHRQRAGREPRQHPVAEGAGDHRARHRDRQAALGGQLARRQDPARPVVHAGGRRHRRRAPGRARPGRRLGARLRGEDRQEALGVRHQPEGLGLAEDAQRSDRTPVIFENVVYIANGQDPEHGEGVGHVYAIDATKRGDITKTGLLWHFDKIRRSISTAAIKDGLIYFADFSGFLHCLDLKTGKPFWMHDMFAAMWSSTMVVGDKVYLGDEDGDVVVIEHGKKKLVSEQNMGSSVYSTVVTANGEMFIMKRNQLYAIQEGAQLKK